MDKNVIIIGAGGHGRVICDTVLSCGDNVVGFIDENKEAKVEGFEYLGDMSVIKKYPDCCFIIAIGNNMVREIIAKDHSELDYYTAIHPSAVVSHSAKIGKGSCIMPHATINSCASIGMHCIINSNAVVEHDCKIADFVHLSPGAVACGTVSIGRLSHIGAGTSIKNNIAICEKVTIGAGAAVVNDISEPGTYVGVPVHRIEK